MNIAFIGLGRMGHGMATRLLETDFNLAVYDQVSEARDRFKDTRARIADSVADAINDVDVVISMLPSDEALEDLVQSEGGILESLPKGAINMVMGTHGVEIIKRLTACHSEAGQVLIAATVLGRPDLAAVGQLTMVPAGPQESLQKLQPIFDILGKQTFIAGDVPVSATIVKIAHNFILGAAIETMGEGVSLVRKYGVDPALLQEVLVKGLFGCPAYEIYGNIIVDEAYDKVGASATIGLKDANLALQAAEIASMPLPSANILRDRLLGAIAHGEEALDWAIVARDQARASGLE